MSAAEAAASRPDRGRSASLWIALAFLVAAGILLAWLGANPLRGETTESGLVFRTIEEGSGDPIQPIDGVLIEYEGRLDDGTVFDSSEGRGPTPMIVGQVIPGFAEALTMMKEGGRYTVRIPSDLAYGSTPPPGSPIPANSDLTFDVEVVQVAPGAALMMQQQGLPGAGGPPQGAPGQGQPEGPPQP